MHFQLFLASSWLSSKSHGASSNSGEAKGGPCASAFSRVVGPSQLRQPRSQFQQCPPQLQWSLGTFISQTPSNSLQQQPSVQSPTGRRNVDFASSQCLISSLSILEVNLAAKSAQPQLSVGMFTPHAQRKSFLKCLPLCCIAPTVRAMRGRPSIQLCLTVLWMLFCLWAADYTCVETGMQP